MSETVYIKSVCIFGLNSATLIDVYKEKKNVGFSEDISYRMIGYSKSKHSYFVRIISKTKLQLAHVNRSILYPIHHVKPTFFLRQIDSTV